MTACFKTASVPTEPVQPVSRQTVSRQTGLLNDDVVIDGHRIATGRHGPPEGRPVLLIHGTPSHSHIWRHIVPPLTAAGYRVHLFDMLGYGASERPWAADTSIAAQEALVPALLAAWGLSRVTLVGHDLGAATGLRVAVNRPEILDGLMMIDGVAFDSWPSPTWQAIIRDHFDRYMAMSETAFREMLTRQLRMTVHNSARMPDALLESYLAPLSGPIGQASFFHHQVRHYDSRHTRELTPHLGRIDLPRPVRLLWGAEDAWQPVPAVAHPLAAAIPGADLRLIPDAGHFAMEDAPEAVTDQILAFLPRPTTCRACCGLDPALAPH